MWEFMTNYADSFWKAGEHAFEVFSVIMAWTITIGLAYFVLITIIALGQMARDAIKEYRK